MIVSPHTHCESPLTGSTLSNLVKQAKALGRTHFAYTDHGHLSSALKAYGQCKKAGLKFIPGIEIYFKDNNCPITAGTSVAKCKYFTLSLYCEDQEAYQHLCKMVSRTTFPTITIYEEKQQLWSWSDLEEISKFNVNVVLGGVHCLVGKPMLAGRADLGEMVLTHLKSIFGSRTYLSLLCEPWAKKWNNVIEVKYTDGTKDSLLTNDQVSTDKARRMRAIDLVTRQGHTFIKSKSAGITHYEVNKSIKDIVLHKGFLPLPGGDVTLRTNRFLKALGNKHKLTLLVTDYAYYANKDDKIVQTMRLDGNDRLHPNLHMKTEQEIADYLQTILNLKQEDIQKVLDANKTWASRFDNFKLDYKWRLADAGGDPIRLAMAIIKKNGRMKWDNPVWVSRLKEEIEVIAKNGVEDLTPYFLPIRGVLDFYTENGFLVGPGRGSAGGSLFCYLLGITQLDPIKYELPFSRFFSMERIKSRKLPDIDVDLEDRTPLVGEDGHSGYLYNTYGNKAAQISTRTTIRLKSAIKDTNHYFEGKVCEEIEVLSEGLPAPPQGISDLAFVFGFDDDEGNHIPGLIEQSEDLKKYSETRPKEWEIVTKAMGLTRAFSKHASAFLLSNVPINDTLPTKEGNIAQYEAKECEAAGLIKYDFLVINQLKDIRVALDLINKKNNQMHKVGIFSHKDKKTYIWDLPEDTDVYKSVWDGSTETIFQINTKSMIPYVKEILPQNIIDVANILALVRPGPLDFINSETGRNMVQEYIMRRNDESQPDIKELFDILPKSYGIIIYQEDLNKIAIQLAGFPDGEAELLRENMAKKKMVELMKMKPRFIEGAIKKVSPEIAETIWDQMVTFGRYGFSIIHATEYALITYACMFLKHHYPLEWWAAILTNATEKEITGKFWPYVKDLVMPPDINLSTDQMVVDYRNGKIRAKLGIVRGMGDATIDPIVANRPYKDIADFVNREVAGPSLTRKLIHVGILDSLFREDETTLFMKLQSFEDSLEAKIFNQKLEQATAKGKKMKAVQPKKGEIPVEYLTLEPMEDAAMRKSILPSLPIDLWSLGKKHSKVKGNFQTVPVVVSSRGYSTPLIDGNSLERLDNHSGLGLAKDIYVASTCYVIETKEFSYPKKNPTKKALKIIMDADGYVSEKVLWADYKSGELLYPSDLKKGAIATFFFRKRIGKKDMSITGVTVET